MSSISDQGTYLISLTKSGNSMGNIKLIIKITKFRNQSQEE